MTLDEAIVNLWEALGEPTDFNPMGTDWITLDPTTRGYIRLNDLLNSGQTACANFKYGRGKQVRFSNLVAHTDVTIKKITAPFDIDNNDAYKLYINKSDLPKPSVVELYDEGRFEGSQIEIYETQYKVDYDNFDDATQRWEIWLTEIVPTDPTDRTCIVSRNSFYFLEKTNPWVGENFKEPTQIGSGIARGNIVYVLKINDMTETQEVPIASLADDFLFTAEEHDVPTEYVLLGKEIKFNYYPPANQRYRIEYYRTPTKITNGSETFEIPEQFHYGIITWAAWQGFLRLHEPEMAFSSKRDWYDFMKSTKNDNDYKWERDVEGSSSIRSS